MAAHRPVVSVYSAEKADEVAETVPMPAVFVSPIRMDVVHAVHTNMAKNKRQAYAVNHDAGMDNSAISWGTGRAVSRIPRVMGGGTNRSGQGAFGNMCRKGRMFAPTQIWRKWHRQSNQDQRRYAVCSALAASALPSLVMARGHKIDGVNELPLVLGGGIENVQKTAEAMAVLKRFGCTDDVDKCKASRKIRKGKGKMRNRRHTMRRGPLVVYNEDNGITQAFRNIPGVELAQVSRLNLLQLAPGGHLGRFCIWTQGAVAKLDSVFGTTRKASDQKKGYKLPRNIMTNTDITRIINSDEVQSKLRDPIKAQKYVTHKKNPLKNLGAMLKLNPYKKTERRQQLLSQEAKKTITKKGAANAKKAGSKQMRKNRAEAYHKEINA